MTSTNSTTTHSGRYPYLAEAYQKAHAEIAALLGSAPSPTNLKPLASELGIQALKRTPLGVAAMLLPKNDGYIALVNRDNSPGVQRFGLAHEISHLLLNRADNRIPTQHQENSLRGSYDSIEQACHELANEILMPQHQVLEIAAKNWGLQEVYQLSTEALVDIEHAAIRMLTLTPHLQAMFIWRRGPNSEPKLVRDFISNIASTTVVGFERGLSIIEIPSACQAFTQEGVFTGRERVLFVDNHASEPITRIVHAESKGSGYGPNRIVHTLATIDTSITQRTPPHARIIDEPITT